MYRKLILALAAAGLAMAAAKPYKMNLYQPAMLGSTELKAGEYQVQIVDQKAVVRSGKTESEAPVKVENGDSKYHTTTVRFTNIDGKLHIQEIRVGGTATKLVFEEQASADREAGGK